MSHTYLVMSHRGYEGESKVGVAAGVSGKDGKEFQIGAEPEPECPAVRVPRNLAHRHATIHDSETIGYQIWLIT